MIDFYKSYIKLSEVEEENKRLKQIISRSQTEQLTMDAHKYSNLLRDTIFLLNDLLFYRTVYRDYFGNIPKDEFDELTKKLSDNMKKIRSIDKLVFDYGDNNDKS